VTPAGARRLAIGGLAAVALFSLVFTQLAQAGRWPATPRNFLHDSDLWTGLAAGVGLLVLLLKRR
jgi:hypothetical protein